MSPKQAVTAYFEALRLAWKSLILQLNIYFFSLNKTLCAQAQSPIRASKRALVGLGPVVATITAGVWA